ncbi:hypothetical protein QTG56_00930 [Rossellomorea sp. AcN35-11]|nr:hypothetical protein QTG56_00930 [Rossellomorea sp. AcN35-11]
MRQLEKRLAERNLKVLHKEIINGAHAGRIYRIETLDDENQKGRLIYKEFETDRSNELDMYSNIPHLIKQFNKVVTVWNSPPKAILMYDLKSPLKKGF